MAMPSDKDILFEKVQCIFQKSNSIQQFENLLLKDNIQTYHRNSKLTGVYFGKRKYRLKNSLGIDPQLLLLKDKTQERFASLQRMSQQQDLDKSNDIEL
jgi:hypothetical protein